MFLAPTPPPVQVDWRTGSIELRPHLEYCGLHVEIAGPGKDRQLEAGDFCFMGNGPSGLAMIGIERKTLTDLLTCMTDNRFVDIQLPGMIKLYDFRYLILEGLNRPNPQTGLLQSCSLDRQGREFWHDVRFGSSSRIYWRDFICYVITLSHAPIKIIATMDEDHTARWVWALHHWYTDKRWQDHKSLGGLYTPADIVMSLDIGEKSLVRRWANDLESIGPKRSAAVDQVFHSGEELASASIEDWQQIPGIGPGIARSAYHEIRGITPLPKKPKRKRTPNANNNEQDQNAVA